MNWHPVDDTPTRSGAMGSDLAYPRGPECFVVEELPLYAASGEGEHLYLELEKWEIDTPELIRRIARALQISEREMGWAGLKDKSATTRQRLSVPRKAGEAGLERILACENLRLLGATPHGNKLRPGHLAGNRFKLLLSGKTEPTDWRVRIAEIEAGGLPNYFGFQRFGSRQSNHIAGLRLLERGARLRGRKQRFLLSAYQSALFNRVLAGRLDRLGTLYTGDLAWLHDRGAIFLVEDPAAEQSRADALAISPSGPLPGGRMTEPGGEVLEQERSAFAEGGWRESFGELLTGGRRPLRVPIAGLAGEWVAEAGLKLEFVLPPGSYASVLLAEFGVRPEGA